MNKYLAAYKALDEAKIKYTFYEGGILWGNPNDSIEKKEEEKQKGLEILERYGV